jgi:hypothetical protein
LELLITEPPKVAGSGRVLEGKNIIEKIVRTDRLGVNQRKERYPEFPARTHFH